jgi:hypothetical protein
VNIITITALNLWLVGMLSATASLGLSLLWDTDIGLSHVDKYTYSSEENIKVCQNIFNRSLI